MKRRLYWVRSVINQQHIPTYIRESNMFASCYSLVVVSPENERRYMSKFYGQSTFIKATFSLAGLTFYIIYCFIIMLDNHINDGKT